MWGAMNYIGREEQHNVLASPQVGTDCAICVYMPSSLQQIPQLATQD